MVGGAARGSFGKETLDASVSRPMGSRVEGGWLFEHAYAPLRDAIAAFGLDGVDLDIEEPMSQQGVTRLVRRLREDFRIGSSSGVGKGTRHGRKGLRSKGFVLTMAPVAQALLLGMEGRRRNLGRFDYTQLERDLGEDAADFYNAQFYNGFGSSKTTQLFDRLVSGFPGEPYHTRRDPRRIVIGQLTNPTNGGGGFVKPMVLARTLAALQRRYGEIGGVAGWEYFNGVPGGEDEPWRWAEAVSAALRPGQVNPRLSISRAVAERLTQAWRVSAGAAKGLVRPEGSGRWAVVEREGDEEFKAWLEPDVDYMAMVNVDGDEAEGGW
jgi:hypothetical protein